MYWFKHAGFLLHPPIFLSSASGHFILKERKERYINSRNSYPIYLVYTRKAVLAKFVCDRDFHLGSSLDTKGQSYSKLLLMNLEHVFSIAVQTCKYT